MKNETRMAALLGTWTAQTHIKARIGPYEMRAHFLVHLMPDPMRSYGCEMKTDDCNEVDNKVCVERDDRNTSKKQECLSIANNVIEWSDVSAFFYFGAHGDMGIPFNIHTSQDLGGWVGPYNVILAQEPLDHHDNNNSSSSSSSSTRDGVVDRYVFRYVASTSTPYLHMHPNCTLMTPDDFDVVFGVAAVNHTAHQQAAYSSTSEDPYAAHLQTCDHGDVQPILPLINFTFVQSPDNDNQEQIQVELSYKVLAAPEKGDILYRLFPTFQRRLNRRNAEFRISGPYCYQGDPHRGYTFDFHYDSEHETDLLQLVHGCVEGLPCVPPTLQGVEQGTDMIRIHTKVATLGSDLMWIVAVVVLSMALLVTCVCACRQRHLLRTMMRNRQRAAVSDAASSGAALGDNDLSQPLLSDQHEQEETETEPTNQEEKTKKNAAPEVTFV